MTIVQLKNKREIKKQNFDDLGFMLQVYVKPCDCASYAV